MQNKYSWLLFDLDNTLLDFSSASKQSLFDTCLAYGIPCNDDIYKIYKIENAKIWKAFEEKKIDTTELRKTRFKSFFEIIGIQNIDPFIFNRDYLKGIVAASQAYEGVAKLLQQLQKSYKLSIITNGLKEVQRARIDKANFTQYFDSITVSDEIGVAKPDIRFFESAFNAHPNPSPKSEMLIIGDSLRSDIAGGQIYDADTCWIDHGASNKTEIQPTHQISNVLNLPSVL